MVVGGPRPLGRNLKKKRKHEITSAPLPQDPAAFLQAVGTGNSAESLQLRSRSEEMLEVAMVSWFPGAASSQPQKRRTALDALSALATMLSESHGDVWLHDLLESSRFPAASKSFVELSRAVQANLAGNPTVALRTARRAQRWMTQTGNRAGRLRAGLEVMYAFQRSADSKSCLAVGRLLEQRLERRPYRWVEAQLALEQSICQNMGGEFALGYQELQHAIRVSQNSKYSVLWLRTMGIRASFYTDIGNLGRAWSEDQSGLAKYWEGSYPEQRAYQFYADLANGAQKQNRWHVAAAFQKEAALTISRTPNRSVEAMAWHRYGALAQTAGMTSEAESGLQQANALFNELPSDSASRTYRQDGELNLAALEAENGDLDASLKRLNSIREQVLEIPNVTILKRFYQTEGTVLVQRGDYAGAERALHRALALANAGFRKLKGDRERFAWKEETAKIYRGLVELRFRWRHDATSALQLWRGYRASANSANNALLRFRYRPRLNAGGVDLAHRDEMVLTYAQLPDGIALWLTTKQRTTAAWINIRAAELKQLVDRFAEECSDPDTSPTVLERDGRQLYTLLIQPVATQLSRSGLLIIETDGVLARVPIQALPDPDGKFLGLEHPIVVSLGSVDGSRQPLMVNSRDRVLAVGDPVLAPELTSYFPPLHSAFQEAQFVRNFFQDGKLLSREAATPRAVLDALAEADVFHFAGHAVFTPAGGRLLLAGPEFGSFLDANDLERLHRRPRLLAVLSSCSSEGGEQGIASSDALLTAFFGVGFAQAVATRWGINSDVTESFMRRFYSAMERSRSVPGALQKAAQETMSQSSTSHPYYWAAFTVYVEH